MNACHAGSSDDLTRAASIGQAARRGTNLGLVSKLALGKARSPAGFELTKLRELLRDDK